MSFDKPWIQKAMSQKKYDWKDREYFQKWLQTSPLDSAAEQDRKRRAQELWERERMEREREYMYELRNKMEAQLQAEKEWSDTKSRCMNEGGWRLFKVAPANRSAVIDWCISTLPTDCWRSSIGFNLAAEVIVKYETHQTAFALRWTE